MDELKTFCEDQSLKYSTLYPISNAKYNLKCKRSENRFIIDHVLISCCIRKCAKCSNPIDSVDNNSDHIVINLVLDINWDYSASSEISQLPSPAYEEAV